VADQIELSKNAFIYFVVTDLDTEDAQLFKNKEELVEWLRQDAEGMTDVSEINDYMIYRIPRAEFINPRMKIELELKYD